MSNVKKNLLIIYIVALYKGIKKAIFAEYLIEMTNKYYSVKPILDPKKPQVFIETYGCQMNVNDSEVVLAILQQSGYALCEQIEDADLILVIHAQLEIMQSRGYGGGWITFE